MEDFSGLAARVAATVGELRGCLILSRDGLVLGAFPEGDDRLVKPAWLRFAALGEPEKGFIEFGEEIWVYVRRGPYAAFSVARRGVRPGLVMDQLEQALLTAEESRSKRETMKVPDVLAAPSGKPRTSPHPEAKPTSPTRVSEPVVVHAEPVAAQASAAPIAPAPLAPAGTGATPSWARPKADEPAAGGPRGALASEPAAEAPSGPGADSDATSATVPATAPAAPSPSPEPDAEPAEGKAEGEDEVDRVMLAQEFSRLLQDGGRRDEE